MKTRLDMRDTPCKSWTKQRTIESQGLIIIEEVQKEHAAGVIIIKTG